MDDVEVSYLKTDLRPPFILSDVKGADFFRVKALRAADTPTFVLKNVENFNIQQSTPVPDKKFERVSLEKF